MAVLQTPWYDRAVETLKLNGKGERTQEAYGRHVRKLVEFFDGRDPDTISEDDLRRYFLQRSRPFTITFTCPRSTPAACDSERPWPCR